MKPLAKAGRVILNPPPTMPGRVSNRRVGESAPSLPGLRLIKLTANPLP
jgi:hypothetical protein